MMTGPDCQPSGAEARAVAWVVPGPLRQLTGGYLYDARIVDGLRQRGWTVGVVDLRSNRWPLDPVAGRRLVSALGRQRWTVVVVDELAHPALATVLPRGRLRRSLRGTPLVVLVHHLRYSEPADRWRQRIAILVEQRVLRAADLVICTSETTARTVRPLVQRAVPVEVVRPGWDTHARHSAEKSGAVAISQGVATRTGAMDATAPDLVEAHCIAPSVSVNKHSLRLLLVGHWTPRKGILAALAAVARLGPGITLDLVGDQDRDPGYAARVRAALCDPALAGRVHAYGRVSTEGLAARYASADALILPSTHEGYGMVLAEALVAGLPVVATRVGAVPEVVRDGCEAALVAPGDVAALAQEIEHLAANPMDRRRRIRLARERAQTLPRWSDSVAAFESHLRASVARTLSGA